MNIRKNLEAVFLVAAVMVNVTAYAVAEVPVASVKPVAPQAIVVDNNMYVVVVKGKRLSAAEKAALN